MRRPIRLSGSTSELGYRPLARRISLLVVVFLPRLLSGADVLDRRQALSDVDEGGEAPFTIGQQVVIDGSGLVTQCPHLGYYDGLKTELPREPETSLVWSTAKEAGGRVFQDTLMMQVRHPPTLTTFRGYFGPLEWAALPAHTTPINISSMVVDDNRIDCSA